MSFNCVAAVNIHINFGDQGNEIWHCFHILPIYLLWSDRTRCHDLSFFYSWILSQLFHSPLSPSFKRLLRYSSFSAIKVVSSAYLRLLIFLPAILIPACASSSPAFRMIYSAYKLNKQGDNIQPQRTPFPILKQSVVPCLVLTAVLWPAYGFLRRQVRWSDIPISLKIFHSLLWFFYQRL